MQATQLVSQHSESSSVIYIGCYEGNIPGHAVCNTARGARHLVALKVFDSQQQTVDTLHLPWDLCNSQLAILHRIAHVARKKQRYLPSGCALSAIVGVLGVTSVQGRPAVVMEQALTDATPHRIFASNDIQSPSSGWRGWPAACDWWECCDDHTRRCPSHLPVWALRIIAHDVARALAAIHEAQARSAHPPPVY